ncbi:MAG: nucleoside hydrolase [Candidatus Omnitrophica bacterium]|nr:nucleoside hydrolase [Candidatus Omnitrophota bacterium]MCM8803007.1 nucleoside hydrolase [Candidatus Omnitrophota bacterium]
MEEKVLLDTDIGSDIDDAICLSYLLSNPDCKLLGVTTVTGEVEKRSIMVSYICEKGGKDIPIFPGSEQPLIGQQRQKVCQQFEYLEKISYKKEHKKYEWLNFLVETVKSNPGEVNLITIGPLTNIGILFKFYPEITELLKGIYIMGGCFFEDKKVEWNIICDPYAAHIVFESNVKNIYICGLDVTTKVVMKKEDIIKNFSKYKLLKEILNFAEIWFRGRDIITFHDPLAASILFKKDICEFKKGNVSVEIENREKFGITNFIEDEKGNFNVAYKVNPERFFSHFFSQF